MSKDKKLKRLADPNGHYKILALDHVSTLRNGLTKMTGIKNIPDHDLLRIKQAVINTLISDISGILLDPDTFNACQGSLPENIGTLIKFESGWTNGSSVGERLTSVNESWTIERVASSKAMGIKLMLYYRPDASKETIVRQKELVKRVGEQCKELGIIFCLEPMWYPMLSDELEISPEASKNLAQRRPGFVIDSLKEFAQPKYSVDLFKLEFPADLHYVKECVDIESSGNKSDSLYDLAFVKNLCIEMGSLVNVPWTVMSSGVPNSVFIQYIQLCKQGNVNGYICGQAIWKNALRAYPDLQKIKNNLINESIPNIQKINEVMKS